MGGLLSHVCIGEGIVGAISWPNTAVTTWSVSQDGGVDFGNDDSSVVMDECADRCSVDDPSEVANDGIDDGRDKSDTFSDRISWYDVVERTGDMYKMESQW